MEPTVFIVNPRGANGKVGRLWPSVLEEARARLPDVRQRLTRGPMEASRLTREALEEGAGTVVAVGGDGTLNEVVNGFMGPDGEPVRPEACLALLPMGTGGDFRKTMSMTKDVGEGLARIAGPGHRQLDVGRLGFVDHEGRPATRYFLNIASFGIGGLVDRLVNKTTKVFGGRISFMMATLRAFRQYRPHRIRLRLDDGPWEEVSPLNVAVANGQYFGGGMWVAPMADPGDGKFEVIHIPHPGLLRFLLDGTKIYKGTHLELPGTWHRSASRVEAECEEEVLLDVDGEAPGRLPATFVLIESRIRMKA